MTSMPPLLSFRYSKIDDVPLILANSHFPALQIQNIQLYILFFLNLKFETFVIINFRIFRRTP